MKKRINITKPLGRWVALLRQVMGATGKGYRKHSLRHTGVGDDRRADKLGAMPAVFRRYRERYDSPGARK